MRWVATCNTVGGIVGIFVGNVIFIWLESADFCNKYVYSQPKDHGLIAVAGLFFLLFITFFVLKNKPVFDVGL